MIVKTWDSLTQATDAVRSVQITLGWAWQRKLKEFILSDPEVLSILQNVSCSLVSEEALLKG